MVCVCLVLTAAEYKYIKKPFVLDVDVASGLLYYMKNNETILVRRVKDEVRSLLMGRNEIATYLVKKGPEYIPPVLQDNNACSRCAMAETCAIYHKAYQGHNTPIVGPLVHKPMDHLQPAHLEFFKKWDNLLSLEDASALMYYHEIWTLDSHEREAKGRQVVCKQILFLEAAEI